MNRIILLGANGFIGKRLHRALIERGTETLPITRREMPSLPHFLRVTDSIVFLAAITPDRDKGVNVFVSNIQIAQYLSEILKEKPVAHLVYISSDAVYPPILKEISEQTPAAPKNLYGTMHLAREQMLKTLSPTTILRLTMVYGAEDTHNSYGPNRFRRMAESCGKITLFGRGEEKRDYIYIDDVVELITLCLDSPQERVLNAATGNSISYAALAEKIAALYRKPIEITTTPREKPIIHRYFDINTLKNSFPQFKLTSIDEGLKRAYVEKFEQAITA